jgi:hypothetical protein
MRFLKVLFILLFIQKCTWFDSNKLKNQDILLYFLIYEEQKKIYFKYSCNSITTCTNNFDKVSNISEDVCGNGSTFSRTHCPVEGFKKMCIIKTIHYVYEEILYDLNKEQEWREYCELIASILNIRPEYKEIYEIKYFY